MERCSLSPLPTCFAVPDLFGSRDRAGRRMVRPMAEEHAAVGGAAPDTGLQWLSIAEAARRLGISERGVRKRIDAGKLDVRRETIGNRVRYRVAVPAAVAPAAPSAASEAVPSAVASAAELAELRARIAGLEAVIEAQQRHLADLRGERDRLLAERPARRRWWWWGGGVT